MAKSTSLMLILTLGLIIIGLVVSANFFSVIGTGGFSDCKIVRPGDVCNEYTLCVYSIERDASCIKGEREVKFDPDALGLIQITETPTPIGGGE